MRLKALLLPSLLALFVLLIILSAHAMGEKDMPISQELEAEDLKDIGSKITQDRQLENNKDVSVEPVKFEQVTESVDLQDRLKPDLVIGGVSIGEQRGDNIKITTTVRNDGLRIAHKVRTEICMDGENIRSEVSNRILPKTESQVSFCYPVSEGKHLLEIFVDPGNEISERNERNNRYTTTLFMGYASSSGADVSFGGGDTALVPTLVGICAAVLLVSLAIEISRYRVFSLFAPLYVKLRKKHILDQFTRGRIYGYIEANPGAHYSKIKEALGLKNGSLAYHLRTLEREEYIKSKSRGIYRCFYPESANRQKISPLPKIQCKILNRVKRVPGLSQKELSEAIGKSKQQINYQVKKLLQKDLIRVERNGRSTGLYPL